MLPVCPQKPWGCVDRFMFIFANSSAEGRQKRGEAGKGKGLLNVLSFLGISWGNGWSQGGVSRNCPSPECFASLPHPRFSAPYPHGE